MAKNIMKKADASTSLPIISSSPSPEWEATVEAMEDGVCIQSLDSKIIRANSAFASMLGLSMEQIIDHSCAEVFNCVGNDGTLPRFCARMASYVSDRCETEEII